MYDVEEFGYQVLKWPLWRNNSRP